MDIKLHQRAVGLLNKTLYSLSLSITASVILLELAHTLSLPFPWFQCIHHTSTEVQGEERA